tara:strand:+ start:85 stop:432 length:348 start_codon:yes stop_codon:yes gene_type:complete
MSEKSEGDQVTFTDNEVESLKELLVYEIDKLSFCLYCKSNAEMHINLKSILSKIDRSAKYYAEFIPLGDGLKSMPMLTNGQRDPDGVYKWVKGGKVFKGTYKAYSEVMGEIKAGL